MKPKSWIQSANLAIEGIIYSVMTQRHMRYHLIAALFVLVLSLLLHISRIEFIFLSLAIILVLVTEMLNTAIEATVDMIAKEFNPQAKIVKDIGAGVVLVASVGALTLAYFILYPALRRAIGEGSLRIVKAPADVVAFVSLSAVIIIVIIIKALVGKGEPLRGGMPSGHAAVSFSLWAATVSMSASWMIKALILLCAVLVSMSRWWSGIHKPGEVVAGMLIGSCVTFLFFWVFT